MADKGLGSAVTDLTNYDVYSFDIDGTVLTKYTGDATAVVIPNGVTEIGDRAFESDCYEVSKIKSVVLPDTVKIIGGRAFAECVNLKSIAIPEGVTTIRNSAFYGCRLISEIVIPDSVVNIGSSAFEGTEYYDNKYNWKDNRALYINKRLISVRETIPAEYKIEEGTLFIADGAFKGGFNGCNKLKKLIIPDSVTSIGDRAFFGLSALTEVWIGNGVTSIGKGAFKECRTLTNVQFGANLKSIGDNAFRECKSLRAVTIPKGVTDIGNYAFYECEQLTDVTLSEGLLRIGEQAFGECKRLVGIDIPEGVTEVGASAFGGCGSLQNLTIPDSVASIGLNAFFRCPVVKAKIPASAVLDIENKYVVNLTVTRGSLEKEVKIYMWDSLVEINLCEGVTRLAEKAFYYSEQLRKVTIPDSVTYIGAYAFAECRNLTSIVYGGSKKQWKQLSKGAKVPWSCNVSFKK